MNGPIDGLLSTLRLTDTGARTNEDIFTGPSQWMPLGRVFGGQVLAQSITAATHTVPATCCSLTSATSTAVTTLSLASWR